MSNFIPLTGSTNIVDQIIQRFQGVPSFDFIEYTDAQKVTGQLFFELIGDPFEPYKGLETFAQIEADPTAIDLVNNSTNAQKVITGIVAEVVGFALDAPDVKAYAGNDGFILLAITNQVSTPDASNLQYRVDGGAWVTVATLTNEIETSYVVLPELPNNQQFTIEARQSLFGTPSLIASRSVTTTPTVANWNAFFNDVSTRNYFYNDSYTDNNTYGALTSKTVMEMIFGSEGVVGAIAENNNTLQIVELNQDNLDLLVTQADGMQGLVTSTNGMNFVVDSSAYRTTIETTATARDAVTGSNVAMPIVAASQDFLNVIEASANFRASVIASQVAIDAFAVSQLAFDTVIASENFLVSYASSEIAMLSVANTPIYFEAFIASQTAMTAVDNVDLAVRILILEQTATQNYTNFTNVADFIDDQTAMAEVAASTDAMRALIASANAVAEKVIEPIALNEVFADLTATLIVANSPTAVTAIAESPTAMGIVDASDELLRIMLLELTDQNYTQFANVQAVLDDETALNAILPSLPNLFIGLNSSVTNFASSESIMTAIVASETTMTAVAASQTAMIAIANSTTAFNLVLASQTAMTAIDQNDLALRILVLEQTNQDYTQFNDFDAVAASETAMTAIAASQTAMTAIAASQTAANAITSSNVAIQQIFTQNLPVTIQNATFSISSEANKSIRINRNFQQTIENFISFKSQIDFTNFTTLNINALANTLGDSSNRMELRLRIGSSTVLSLDGTQTSFQNRTINVSSFTGLQTIEFGYSSTVFSGSGYFVEFGFPVLS